MSKPTADEFDQALVIGQMQLLKIIGDKPEYRLIWPAKEITVELSPAQIKSVGAFRTAVMYQLDILSLKKLSQERYEDILEMLLKSIQEKEIPVHARIAGTILDNVRRFVDRNCPQRARYASMDRFGVSRDGRAYFKPSTLEGFLFGDSEGRYHYQRQSIPRETIYDVLQDHELRTNEVIKIGKHSVRCWSVPIDIWQPDGRQPVFELKTDDEGEENREDAEGEEQASDIDF